MGSLYINFHVILAGKVREKETRKTFLGTLKLFSNLQDVPEAQFKYITNKKG